MTPGSSLANWQPRRLGANPPAGLVRLADRATREVWAACGIAPAVFAGADGTAPREAWRQSLFGTIAPLGRIIVAELREKIDPSISLSWDELRASDLSGRARAFQSTLPDGTPTRVAPDGTHESGCPISSGGPTSWAHLTARLQGEIERSLADEAGGPIAQILSIPEDGGDGEEDDPLAELKADVAAARGKALLLETTSAGYGQGRQAAPGNGNRDWVPSRLGPNPPVGVVQAADAAFTRMLAACGCPPGMFEAKADGTAQREALRRWHLGTVEPLARVLEHELTWRLETEIRLRFDQYPKDIAGRASAFKALVTGGMDMTQAAAVSGVLAEDE